MAKVFLDTNFLLDITERDPSKSLALADHQVFISPLSYHILFYTYKYQVSKNSTLAHKDEFRIVDFTDKILTLALQGPTQDLEDNIQLHSSSEADCDIFLTSDKNLLSMRFFGKTRLLSSLS